MVTVFINNWLYDQPVINSDTIPAIVLSTSINCTLLNARSLRNKLLYKALRDTGLGCWMKRPIQQDYFLLTA